jgi:hypothetical protein
MIELICPMHAHGLSHILRSQSGHLFDLLINSLEEYLPLFFEALLAPVKQPRNDLCVLELHFGLLVVCPFDLYHVDLIDLLLDLFDFFI